VQWGEASSWLQPELLTIPEDQLKGWLKQPDLAVYSHYFDDLLRTRKHILSAREEELLAMAGKATAGAGEAFSLLSNTELRWRTVKGPDGKDVEITSSSFYQAMYSKARSFRKDAFTYIHVIFLDVKNTLAATLGGTLQQDWFYSKARRYPTSLDRALDAENLPAAVYDTLTKTVNDHRELLHRYVRLKKKVLKLEDGVHFYDLYVNLVDVPERNYTSTRRATLFLTVLCPLARNTGQSSRRRSTAGGSTFTKTRASGAARITWGPICLLPTCC
jgi:oligoendopeptidase F